MNGMLGSWAVTGVDEKGFAPSQASSQHCAEPFSPQLTMHSAAALLHGTT